MVIAPVVAVPLNSRTEADAVAIAKVPLVTVPVRLRVPPEAVIELLFEIGMPIVPEPLTAVVAEIVPVPLIVPPAIVRPAASVSWVVPAPSSLTVLAPTASALVRLKVPAVFSSKVPVEPAKVTPVAVLAASSFKESVLPPPTVRLSRLVTVPVSSSVPPLAVMPFVVPVPPLTTLPTILPNPVSVPALVELPRVIPEASVSVPPDIWILPSETVSAALIVRLPPLPTCSVWLALVMLIAPVVAVPVNSSTEADAVAIAKVPLVTVPVRLRVPLEAVIELLFEIGMPIVPEPVTAVVAEIVPLPLIVPPAVVIPAVSVSWVVPAPSSLTVLAPIASALVRVRVPEVFSSTVPVEPEKESEVAALPASSKSLSLAPLPTVSAREPLLPIPEAISKVPPEAVIAAAPVAVMAPVTLPRPVIVPVLNAIPALSVSCELAPSSLTVLAPTPSALVRVKVPAVFSSKVPVEPEKVSPVAVLAASSFKESVLPLPTVRLSILVAVPVISSVPPLAVTVFVVPVPPLTTLPTILPNPVSVPALVELPRVIPEASVNVPPTI